MSSRTSSYYLELTFQYSGVFGKKKFIQTVNLPEIKLKLSLDGWGENEKWYWAAEFVT